MASLEEVEMPGAEEIAAWQVAVVLATGEAVFSTLGLGMEEYYVAEEIADAYSYDAVNPDSDPNLYLDSIVLAQGMSRHNQKLKNIAYGHDVRRLTSAPLMAFGGMKSLKTSYTIKFDEESLKRTAFDRTLLSYVNSDQAGRREQLAAHIRGIQAFMLRH
jgi:hypothetical protein